jgi:hypothetical protein
MPHGSRSRPPRRSWRRRSGTGRAGDPGLIRRSEPFDGGRARQSRGGRRPPFARAARRRSTRRVRPANPVRRPSCGGSKRRATTQHGEPGVRLAVPSRRPSAGSSIVCEIGSADGPAALSHVRPSRRLGVDVQEGC